MKELVPEQVCAGEDHEENATRGSTLAEVHVDERQQDEHEDEVVDGEADVVETSMNVVCHPGWKPADVFLDDVQKVRCGHQPDGFPEARKRDAWNSFPRLLHVRRNHLCTSRSGLLPSRGSIFSRMGQFR